MQEIPQTPITSEASKSIKSNNNWLIRSSIIALIFILLGGIIFGYQQYKNNQKIAIDINGGQYEKESSESEATTISTSLSTTNEKTEKELIPQEISTFKKEFLEKYPHHNQAINDLSIRKVSKFSFRESNRTGWIIAIESPKDKNYSDRYLAFMGEMTMFNSDVAIECSFPTTGAKTINESVFYPEGKSLTQQSSSYVILEHGCASISLVSILNIDKQRQVPFSDPNNLMKNNMINDNGDIVGLHIHTFWNDVVAIELQGEPLMVGYAAFDLKSGELLKTLEFNSL